MPPLNWPFISQHLKLKAEGWQFTKHRAHSYSRLATHKRLFRKLRRRQQTIREPYLFTSTKHHALTLLRNLTKHTLASFEAAKQLRSGRHTDLEVYAIRRMASNLEEPGRTRALHIINKALHYRNLTPPKPNIPLTVPFLAHDDFTKHCQQWLQTTIQQHKHLAIPLHLPTHRLRKAAHKTLQAQLHNHRVWEDTLHTPPDLLDPATATTNDHYILTLDQLALPPHQMASDARPPDFAQSALGAFPSTSMATSHYTPQATTTFHCSPPPSTSRIPGRRSRAPPCGPRTPTTPDFLPTSILHWSAQHLARSGTLRTPSTSQYLQHSRPPLRHHPSQPTLPIQMRLQERFHYPIRHCSPQRKEAVAEGTYHHLVLPLPEWQPPTHHQPSA